MKVFITGGAGFIGSNVAQYFLTRNHDVVIYDNLSTGYRENIPKHPRLTFLHGDVLDREQLIKSMRGADAILHLAASVGNLRSIENPKEDARINVFGMLHLLEGAREHGISKLVYSSSAGIFGEPQQLPIDEHHPTHPDSPYGVSKLAAELHGLCYSKLYGMDVVCLRYFNVYGPNQHYDAYGNVIPIFATCKLKEEPMTIYGDGEQTRDFIHVEDVAQANYLAATTRGIPGAYNIGSGNAITINTLAAWMHEVTQPAPATIKHAPPRKGDVRHSLANIAKAKKILQFFPKRELQSGLKEYWKWIHTL